MLAGAAPTNNGSKKGEIILPFLKWAGGKRWLANQHFYLFPTQFKRFVEPFLGSGAVFFRLNPTKAILSDNNEELINTYIQIRDKWKIVQNGLEELNDNHSKELYYRIRAKIPDCDLQRAIRFIYLNRTCWNGLYRVNLKGQFNVPIGTKNRVIFTDDDFNSISKLLRKASFSHCDFEKTIDRSREGDFIFADPPYTVKHNFNGFLKYNQNLFSWKDQIRLRNSLECAIRRGAKVLVTNANHESILDLYNGLGEQILLERASVISGKRSGRGIYQEVAFKCY